MGLNAAACYRAVLARDERFDGKFFTCVKTTRVYCRPICPARPPKFPNCIFVVSAAAAQEAGFRPCLRCRPESSPVLAASRGSSASVSRALALIERGALDHDTVAALGERLGFGERQLRRLFRQHLGATPRAVAQTRRVLLAKQLIHQSELSLTAIASASGFGSVRRFNETFRALYGKPPRALRRVRAAADSARAAITLLLPYRPPYDFGAMLEFLRARCVDGVEHVADQTYLRVVQVGTATGWIEVRHAPELSALRTTVHLDELSALPRVIACVRRAFDLAADPVAIGAALRRDPYLAKLVAQRPGLRVPGGFGGFEVAVRALLGQQITVQGARKLASRFAVAFGEPLTCDAPPPLTRAFPAPQAVREAGLSALGMPAARRSALLSLARAASDDATLLEPSRSLEAAVARLCELSGVGAWSAHYIAMRGLGESDAFPPADVGLLRAWGALAGRRPNPPQLLARAERWRPFRAYAAQQLWSWDTGRVV